MPNIFSVVIGGVGDLAKWASEAWSHARIAKTLGLPAKTVERWGSAGVLGPTAEKGFKTAGGIDKLYRAHIAQNYLRQGVGNASPPSLQQIRSILDSLSVEEMKALSVGVRETDQMLYLREQIPELGPLRTRAHAITGMDEVKVPAKMGKGGLPVVGNLEKKVIRVEEALAKKEQEAFEATRTVQGAKTGDVEYPVGAEGMSAEEIDELIGGPKTSIRVERGGTGELEGLEEVEGGLRDFVRDERGKEVRQLAKDIKSTLARAATKAEKEEVLKVYQVVAQEQFGEEFAGTWQSILKMIKEKG